MKVTIQAKRLKTALNNYNILRYGEAFNKSFYTPLKNGCFTTITVHADALNDEQILGLKTELPYVDIYNDVNNKFSIIRYG